MRLAVKSLLVAVAVLVVSTACPPGFTPYWKVDKLRLLGIKADPVVADHMETVELSALVYAPGDPDLDYEWSWCPLDTSADDNYECPVDGEDFQGFAPGGDESDSGESDIPDEPFDLGEESTATLPNFFEPEEVRQFCEAIQQQFVEETDNEEMAELLPGGDCEEGYEVSVRLEVSSAEDSIVAKKGFKLSAGADNPNENPEFVDFQVRPDKQGDLQALIEGADWDVEPGADRADQWVSVPPDEPFAVVEGIPLEFRALVDPDSLQAYTRATDDEPRREGLVYRHFTTAGGLSSSRQIYGPEQNTLEDASNTVHQMDSESFDEECRDAGDGTCRLHVWSVVRDDRLGIDWIGRQFEVRDGEEQ